MSIDQWFRRLARSVPRRRGPRAGYASQFTPRLFIRELEERRVLNGSSPPWGDPGDDVVIDARDHSPSGGAEIVVARDGEDVRVSVNSTEVYRAPWEETASITVTGTEFDDSLTVDLAGGDPTPTGGLVFHGMGDSGGGDRLILAGDPAARPVQTVTHRFVHVGDGFIDLSMHAAGPGASPSTVSYTGVGSITDQSQPTELAFLFSPGDESVVLSDDSQMGTASRGLIPPAAPR